MKCIKKFKKKWICYKWCLQSLLL